MIIFILNIIGETRKVEASRGVSGTGAVANLAGFFFMEDYNEKILSQP